MEDSEELPSFLVKRSHGGDPYLGDTSGRELSEREKRPGFYFHFLLSFFTDGGTKTDGILDFFPKEYLCS